MIRKLITLLLITIIHSSVHLAFAQEYTPASTTTESTGDYSVRGKVVDADGEPEIYATYRIYLMNDTTKTVCIGTTDVDGNFATQLPNTGDYILYISAIGKDTIKRPFSVCLLYTSDAADD